MMRLGPWRVHWIRPFLFAGLLFLECTGATSPPRVDSAPPTPLPALPVASAVDRLQALHSTLPTLLESARRDASLGAWRDWLQASAQLAELEQGHLAWDPTLRELQGHPRLAQDLLAADSQAATGEQGLHPLVQALCLLARGQDSDHTLLLESLDSLDVAGLELRAWAWEALGHPGRAADALETLARAQPGRVDLSQRVGRLWLAAGKAPHALPWARLALRHLETRDEARLLMADIALSALSQCREVELDFDDQLLCQAVDEVCAAVERADLQSQSRRRRERVAEQLPTAEDRFFNHYDQPRKACYQWLLPLSDWRQTTPPTR